MDGIYLTEDELWALSRCSGIAVKAYLRLRARMDLRTGVVGVRSGISYRMIQEWAAQAIEKGGGETEEMPTYKQARVAVEQLVRRGLLARAKADKLIFRCSMAELVQVRSKRTGHVQGRGKEAESGTVQGTNRAELSATDDAGFEPFDHFEQGTEQGTYRAGQKPPNGADIRDGVNPIPPKAACTDSNAVDAAELIRAAGLAKMSSANREADDDIQPRAVQLAIAARKGGASLTPSDPRVRQWVVDGVYPRHVEQACEIAKERRRQQGATQAINAGYLTAILPDVLNPPKPRAVAPAWWASHAAMDAKAAELGICGARAGESEIDFKSRIRAAMAQASEGVTHGHG